MLSWALKRNAENTRDAFAADESQIDQPDTPAPVFAVRALKTALFGTPAPRGNTERAEEHQDMAADDKAFHQASTDSLDTRSPAKPPGILLTPGTGTSRRKRVSFGHDVKQGPAVQPGSQSGLPDECPGKFPSPWVAKDEGGSQSRPKTRLTEALERSRKNNNKSAKDPGTDIKDFAGSKQAQPSEDQWEEVEDFERDPDVTVDLNEPHSRSGKYWKTQFEDYHADARAEMEKLVKYKQLAKSYAKKKDKEASELNEKLKEEQEKVRQVERQVVELGRQVTLKAKRSGGEYDSDLVDELARETALALDYKQQVKELEDLLRDNDEEADEKGTRRKRIASPRTQQTLLEAQRELRRARNQVKDLGRLREERDKLRSELKFAEQRATKLADENKKIAGDVSKASTKAQELEKELENMRRESRQKDRELQKLKDEFDKLKENAKARFVEAEEVVRTKNDKISGLKDEIVSLKAGGTSSRLSAKTKALEARVQVGSENNRDSAREDAFKPPKAAGEGENVPLPKKVENLGWPTFDKGPARETSRKAEKRRFAPHDDDELHTSRALWQSIETGMGKRRSSPLSDRENLQNAGSSSSLRRQELASLPRNPREKALNLGSYDTDPSAPITGAGEEVIIRSSIRPRSTFLAMEQHQQHQQQHQQHQQQTQPQQPPIKPPARPSSSDSDGPQVDLVHSNFARLGAALDLHQTSSVLWGTNASRTSLPADRRAAAIARLERKKAERARELRGLSDRNKENVRP